MKERGTNIQTKEKINPSIRGHHFALYAELVKIASYLSAKGIGTANEIAAQTMARRITNSAILEEPEYMNDVVGKSSETHEVFYNKIAGIFQDFLNASNNTHVQVLSEKPDDICRCCIIGKHCTERLKNPVDTKYIAVLFGIENPSDPFHIELGRLKDALKTTSYDQLVIAVSRLEEPLSQVIRSNDPIEEERNEEE